MSLTSKEKLLIRGLMLFKLKKETMEMIFVLLETDEQRMAMMEFMAENREATEQDILQELWRIRKI